jgi:IS30 family transposase
LTIHERHRIAVGVELEMSIRAIGRMIGRTHTTVQRELTCVSGPACSCCTEGASVWRRPG